MSDLRTKTRFKQWFFSIKKSIPVGLVVSHVVKAAFSDTSFSNEHFLLAKVYRKEMITFEKYLNLNQHNNHFDKKIEQRDKYRL